MEKIREFFSKNWIDKLYSDYSEMISRYNIINKGYFDSPGTYVCGYRLNDNYLDKIISDYFDRLLYFTNIACLDYIIDNLDEFKDLKFLDNGSGFGLLSVFMKQLNIECYNFDNYDQMGDFDLSEEFFYKKYNIYPPSKLLPNDMDVLLSNGIYVTDDNLIDYEFDYLFIDNLYLTEHNDWNVKWPNRKRFWSKIENSYDEIYRYDNISQIFKHK